MVVWIDEKIVTWFARFQTVHYRCIDHFAQLSAWSVGRSEVAEGCQRSIPFLNELSLAAVLMLCLTRVRNGSKFPGRFQFGFRPKPVCANGSYHTKNPAHWKWVGFTTKNPAFTPDNFACNWIFQFWLYRDLISTLIVQIQPHCHLPISDLRSNQYSLSCYRKSGISLEIYPYLRATQLISVWSQIWMLEEKELVKLHHLRIHQVMIRSELKYFIAAKAIGTVKLVPRSGSNPAKHPQFYVRSG